MASRPDKPGKKRAGKDLVKRSMDPNEPKRTSPEDEEAHRPIEELPPETAAAARPKDKLILELMRTGNIESLLKAFQTSPWTVSDVISALVGSGHPTWAEDAPRLTPALVWLLEEWVHEPWPYFGVLSKALGGGFHAYIVERSGGGLDFFVEQERLMVAPAPQAAVESIDLLPYYEVPTSPEFKVERELERDDWVTQRLAETAKEFEIRKAAIAQIIAPRHEEPAEETLPPSSSLGSVDLQPPTSPSTDVISSSVGTELTFSYTLTIRLEFEDTIPVISKDASQHVTSGPAAALPPHLDLSSFQITTDHRRGDFSQPSPAEATPSEVRADGVDLANAIFTTTDPTVLRTRMLIFSEPSDGLFQLDIFEHGKKVLERIERRREPTAEEVQLYLNRLKDFDFRTFSIDRKHEVANLVNRLFDASGLDVLISDPKQGGRLTRITRTKCYVPNERSKGSFQARIGKTTVYTGKTWPDLIVRKPDWGAGDLKQEAIKRK